MFRRKPEGLASVIDFGRNSIDITVFGSDSPIRTLRTAVVSGPVNPKPGERITLEIVAVERRVWQP